VHAPRNARLADYNPQPVADIFASANPETLASSGFASANPETLMVDFLHGHEEVK
jgi:hypothetical protein